MFLLFSSIFVHWILDAIQQWDLHRLSYQPRSIWASCLPYFTVLFVPSPEWTLGNCKEVSKWYLLAMVECGAERWIEMDCNSIKSCTELFWQIGQTPRLTEVITLFLLPISTSWFPCPSIPFVLYLSSLTTPPFFFFPGLSSSNRPLSFYSASFFLSSVSFAIHVYIYREMYKHIPNRQCQLNMLALLTKWF